MAFIHANDVIHRDLKGKNILLSKHGVVKIGDFGLARYTQRDVSMTHTGTPYYMAPELLMAARYDEKVDVFGFAMVMWEVVARARLYDGMNRWEVPPRVAKGELRPTINPQWPAAVTALLCDCWSQDPDERPSFTEILRRLDVAGDPLEEEEQGESTDGVLRQEDIEGVLVVRAAEALERREQLEKVKEKEREVYFQRKELKKGEKEMAEMEREWPFDAGEKKMAFSAQIEHRAASPNTASHNTASGAGFEGYGPKGEGREEEEEKQQEEEQQEQQQQEQQQEEEQQQEQQQQKKEGGEEEDPEERWIKNWEAGSKYRGVSWQTSNNKWQAEITFDGGGHYLGCFDDEEEAARAYDRTARTQHGEKAQLNFPAEANDQKDLDNQADLARASQPAPKKTRHRRKPTPAAIRRPTEHPI
jgi:NIMA (never in mitosis gene a)-related kinase